MKLKNEIHRIPHYCMDWLKKKSQKLKSDSKNNIKKKLGTKLSVEQFFVKDDMRKK
jgi:hypothetical protein